MLFEEDEHAEFLLRLADLDELPLSEAQPNHYKLQLHLTTAGTSFGSKNVISKETFNIGKYIALATFEPEHGNAAKAPLFAVIGEGAKGTLSQQSPEDLLKSQPNADILIVSLEFQDPEIETP